MSTLSVFKFSTVDGARQLGDALLDLHQRQLVEVQDAVLLTWPQGGRSPKSAQLRSLAGPRALTEAFWGMLFGLIFFVPFFGLTVIDAIDALGGKFSDYGINEAFTKQVRAAVTEGTAALFVLTSGAVQDKVVASLQDQSFDLISMNLPKQKEDALRAVFSAQ